MKADDQIKLDALNYCQTNKRPISSIKDYVTGYEKCITDIKNMDFSKYIGLTEIIFSAIDKKISNQFYDPEMGYSERKELEEKQNKLNELFEVIKTYNI